MASPAYADYLSELLLDAEELEEAHKQLRTGKVGRQWGLGALNRGVVVLSVSAWEAYVEELAKVSLDAIRPAAPPMGVWPSLNASARSQIGRFNTPTPGNVKNLFAETLGLPDVTASWAWQHMDNKGARDRLEEALQSRHKIAHGVNPRPVIHNQYAKRLPAFFKHLGECTDRAVRTHLVGVLGVANPWPQ